MQFLHIIARVPQAVFEKPYYRLYAYFGLIWFNLKQLLKTI